MTRWSFGSLRMDKIGRPALVGRHLLFGTLVLASLVLSEGPVSQAVLLAEPTLYTIRPSQTDPLITEVDNPHYVYINKSLPLRQRLVVFLPGSFSQPRSYTMVLTTAANLGYHAIGLSYVNTFSVGPICDQSEGASRECEHDVRLENLDGRDRIDLIEVDRRNSIENRLFRLLQYLDRTHPQDGFGQFLIDGVAVDWPNLLIAGHSQGGGNAAIAAKYRLVAGVVMLSSPGDWNESIDLPAPWVTRPGISPASAFFGMGHDKEGGQDKFRTNWEALDLAQFGDPVLVDETTQDFQDSHRFVATIEPDLPHEYHRSTASDRYTPLLSDGSPAYRGVWEYMLVG